MFVKDKYGFWRQTDAVEFDYTEEYAANQSTTMEMANLRMGWILSILPLRVLKKLPVVDVGAGNRAMAECLEGKTVVKSYDVVGESISREELMSTDWGLAIFADVLEHVEDLEFLF
ncbi:MAG TPA: hypothetical protein ENH11_08795, partial [Candidatus Acetothermia bacterium]|nr:hypothetical protein [Candidatus Acetothermia bacterium]